MFRWITNRTRAGHGEAPQYNTNGKGCAPRTLADSESMTDCANGGVGRAIGYLPGKLLESDAELLHEAGNIATIIFHTVDTYKMGIDQAAVIDPQLKFMV